MLTLLGAAWVFSFSGGVWSQVGNKLVGSGGSSSAYQGTGVAISADAVTIAVGGYQDTGGGSVWIFTFNGSSYGQEGGKITANPSSSGFGQSVALSSDTLIVGAIYDNNGVGAMYVFTRSEVGVWSQQGGRNVGTDYVGTTVNQGRVVAISANGNVAAVGGPYDNNNIGATWIFTRNSSNIWAQYGDKLVGSDYAGTDIKQGDTNSISVSADGAILFVGGWSDNTGVGAAWPFHDNNFSIMPTESSSAPPLTPSPPSSDKHSTNIAAVLVPVLLVITVFILYAAYRTRRDQKGDAANLESELGQLLRKGEQHQHSQVINNITDPSAASRPSPLASNIATNLIN